MAALLGAEKLPSAGPNGGGSEALPQAPSNWIEAAAGVAEPRRAPIAASNATGAPNLRRLRILESHPEPFSAVRTVRPGRNSACKRNLHVAWTAAAAGEG